MPPLAACAGRVAAVGRLVQDPVRPCRQVDRPHLQAERPGLAYELHVLVHDAQFLEHERPRAVDYGHATVDDAIRLDPATVHDTLGVLLKYQDDIVRLQSGDTAKLLDELRARALLE